MTWHTSGLRSCTITSHFVTHKDRLPEPRRVTASTLARGLRRRRAPGGAHRRARLRRRHFRARRRRRGGGGGGGAAVPADARPQERGPEREGRLAHARREGLLAGVRARPRGAMSGAARAGQLTRGLHSAPRAPFGLSAQMRAQEACGGKNNSHRRAEGGTPEGA